jgi:nucleotide-binding universal stress UspA family protein
MPGRSRIATGATIDGFAIGAQVHAGGMAVLWEATHPAHPDLPLLMKVPRLREGEDPAAIVGFEMEQMILPRLAGPHVPRFVAAAGFERQPYLVMERILGTSLAARLSSLPLAAAEVAAIGARVAEALDSLHRQSVVHLDVKPSNILFRRGSGEAVLVDFGLARHRLLPDLLEEEFRLPYGSAPYMAPEQAMGVRGEPRSDLFALGAILYQLKTGMLPFGEPQGLKAVRRRIWRDPLPPRALRPTCPPWLQEIILRCLEVDPVRRHPTAAQLAFDLRHPDQVALSPRAEKRRRDGWAVVLRRRFDPKAQPVFRHPSGEADAVHAPIVAVAVDVAEQGAAVAQVLRAGLGPIMASLPGARVACINVLDPRRAAPEEGENRHVQRLVALRHWAAPLGLPEGRLTYHVLESTNPAQALIEYATANRVDHIVMGARADSLRRRLLGSVSAEVASHAPCTVTVVRPRPVNTGGTETGRA